jgi:hypothetical protein
MGCEGEIIVPMDGCDHRTVCRFPNESSGCKLVLGHIQRLASGELDYRQPYAALAF